MGYTVKVKVPATSANLGPGFDCLGAALGLYNNISLEVLGKTGKSEVVVRGCGRGLIPENSSNLAYKVIKCLFAASGKVMPAVRLELNNNIPVARGLGSSASVIAGSLIIANKLLGDKYTVQQLIKKAVEIEGHADNVAPAFLGGLCITRVENGEIPIWKARVAGDLEACLCIPEFTVATKKARELMPLKYSRNTSVFTASGTAFFVAAVTAKCSPERDYIIMKAMEDRFHQPHRKKLIRGMDQVFTAGKKAGALGIALSGSGPSIIAVVKKKSNVSKIGEAMAEAFQKAGVKSCFKVLNFISNGADLI